MYICSMKTNKKKSKRLEFTQATIAKFSKVAKKQGSCFKLYAEKLITDKANETT